MERVPDCMSEQRSRANYSDNHSTICALHASTTRRRRRNHCGRRTTRIVAAKITRVLKERG
eukprot:8064804-Lingulodinium_polyedra.AAC.1